MALNDRELNLVRASAEAAGVRALVPTDVPFGVLQVSYEHSAKLPYALNGNDVPILKNDIVPFHVYHNL